jgi:hypothetical protein
MPGYFKSRHIWIIADSLSCVDHKWYKNYPCPFTTVMGKLGCKTSSNLLVVGEAEKH